MRTARSLPALTWACALAVAGPTFATERAAPAHCLVPGYSSIYVAGPALYVGGEQDAEQLERLRGLGVKHIVDLRPADSAATGEPGEAALATELGLGYRNIGVTGAKDLTRENASALHDALVAANGEPVLVHCASGNRAAALLALRDAWFAGKTTEQSLSFSRRSGLTALEADVLKALQGAGSTPAIAEPDSALAD